MTYNWQEIPAIIIRCNQTDITVYFHAVYSPIHATLRYRGSIQLQYIQSFYEKELACLEGPQSECQRRNRQAYLGLITQIEVWKKEAEAREKDLVYIYDMNEPGKRNNMLQHLESEFYQRLRVNSGCTDVQSEQAIALLTEALALFSLEQKHKIIYNKLFIMPERDVVSACLQLSKNKLNDLFVSYL